MSTKRLTVLLFVILMLVWCVQLDAKPSIDPYNIVRVRCGNSYGSGVYIGDRVVLTAAHIFDGGSSYVRVAFPRGNIIPGELRGKDSTWDQALVKLDAEPKRAKGAPLATEDPKIGEKVYAAGYPSGGTKGEWLYGEVSAYASPSTTGPTDWFVFKGGAAKRGVSGGPVYNSKGEVIGNLWGSRQVEMSTTALTYSRTSRFLGRFGSLFSRGRRIRPQQGRRIHVTPRPNPSGPCSTGACPSPGSGGARMVPGSRGTQIVPRDPGGNAPVVQGPPVDQSPPGDGGSMIGCDPAAVADIVWQRMQDNPEKFQGPPGEDAKMTPDKINEIANELKQDSEFVASLQGPQGPEGPQGPQGPEGKSGEDAELTQQHMQDMVAAITRNLKQDSEFKQEVQGPAGDDAEVTTEQLAAITATIVHNLKQDEEFQAKVTGPPGESPDLTELKERVAAIESIRPITPPGGWSHLVLVADSSAEYWNRLAGEFQRAKGHWNELRVVQEPDDRYIGPLPILVAYEAGKPMRNWVGLRDVSEAFSNIARGEYDKLIADGEEEPALSIDDEQRR